MIRFDDAKEVLNILRDKQLYLFAIHKNDKLAEGILTRITRILEVNDNTKLNGEANENTKQEGTKRN